MLLYKTNACVCREQEAHMSLTMAIMMMIGAWLLVAACMLWGVLRIARRHHRGAYPLEKPRAPAKAPRHTAGAH